MIHIQVQVMIYERMHPTDRQHINHVSLHITLVTVRHTLTVFRHPSYVLVGAYAGNYTAICNCYKL